jgi:hypothetical protein
MTIRSISLFLIFLIAALATTPTVEAKGWRGIVPLHTTRAEVEKILGPPTEQQSEYSVLYRTADESVIIGYTRGLPCGIGEKYSQWRVPRDTVHSILITPNMGSPLSKLSIDESKYKKRRGADRAEDIYYINDEDGEILRVFQNDVMEITYSAAASDEPLRCTAGADLSNTKCEGLASPAFDTYGEISIEQERRRLDNFLIALTGQKGSEGYIIGYGGKRSRFGEPLIRAQRARSYLAKVRSFPIGQLEVIDGGYRDKATVELFVVAPGSCSPTATPTIDPRDVQILRGGTRKKNRRSS